MEKIKLKQLTKEQLIISVDRLTRFKDTETKYLRVFKEIITNNIIYPKYKKSELDNMDYDELKNLAEFAINKSLEKLGIFLDDDYLINQRLFDYENSIFILDNETQKLIKNKINYKGIISLLNENAPINLKWLKALENCIDIKSARQKFKLRFPIEKIILSEGITEEILLPEFAKHCGYDFDENGVYVISAGGKNQVVKYFYRFAQNLKIPIFVLLDNDAKKNLDEIKPKLRADDKIHLLKCGEFEDLLPHSLIEKTINYSLKYISAISLDDLKRDEPMVKVLEDFFKDKGFHEFKKSEFAQSVKENISSIEDISDEIKDIIKEIYTTSNKVKQ